MNQDLLTHPPPVQYVTTSDGLDIAYRVRGKGRPFVLTPFPFNNLSRMWQQRTNLSLYEALSERFRLIHYDSRGQGMSSRDLGADHSYDDYMSDLDAVVERLELDSFLLFAGLLSCHTAIRYAVRNPKRVQALIFTSAPIRNPVGGLAELEQLAANSWDAALVAFIGGNVRIGDKEGDAASVDYFRDTITQEGFISMMRACRRSNIEASLGSVACPTLIVSGRMHPPAMMEADRKIAAAIPHARLVLLEQGRWLSDLYTNDGSIPPIVHAIDDFLEALPDATASPSPAVPSSTAGAADLSPRETEVLRLVAQGKTNRQIAEELVISERTVINHLSHIFIKTGAENRAGATAYALRHGLA